MSLRRIEPLSLPPGWKVIDQATIGKAPSLIWVEMHELCIDEDYQRDLTRKSTDLIKRIVSNFSWGRYQPPTICRAEGQYKVIDGQHTAIAACTMGLKRIPCLLVGASEIEQQAGIFVDRNTQRLAMSRFDLYRASIMAGNQVAIEADRLCRDIGIRIRMLSPHGTPRVGDCGSVGTIQMLVKTKGAGIAGAVLRTLVLGKRAPITTPELDAVAKVVVAHPGVSPAAFGKVIADMGNRGLDLCLAESKTRHIKPAYVLMETYLKKLKQAGAVEVAA